MKKRFTPFLPVYFILFIIITAFHVTSSTAAEGPPQSIAESAPATIESVAEKADDSVPSSMADASITDIRI